MEVSTTKTGAALDTLAQLRKRSRNKYITNGLIYKLVNLDSTLKKSYWNSYHCFNTIDQTGTKLSGMYCGQRWCNQCNRIKTGKLLNGYMPALKEMAAPYFVTLTIPTKPNNGKELPQKIELMHKVIRNISDMMRKRKTPLKAIRKLECTYKPDVNKFHPHFHLIVSGKEAAKELIKQWLVSFPDASRSAQDIKPADNNSMKELFKYFSKLITKNSAGANVFNPEALDTIFRAMKGKRVFQSMGIKRVSENIENHQVIEVKGIKPNVKVWQYDDFKSDWIDKEGNRLTGYVPSQIIKDIRGLPDIVPWDMVEKQMKAIKRFDQRKYYEERAEYWSEQIYNYLKTA